MEGTLSSLCSRWLFQNRVEEELDRFFLLLFPLIGQYASLDMCLRDGDGFKQDMQ